MGSNDGFENGILMNGVFAMTQTVIYHNPRCSKSRLALELLRKHKVEPKIVRYLDDPPSAERLDALCRALGKSPLEIMRTKEPLFKELELSLKDQRDRSEWLRILAENPKLLERPIVIRGNEVVIGRPPERVLELL